MKRPFLSVASALVLSLGIAMPMAPAFAKTIDLSFMPPKVKPQEICSKDATTAPQDDLSAMPGEGALTDEMRLRFLLHDIRVLQSTDPNRWFDFILTLLDWRTKLDSSFSPTDAELAKIELYIDQKKPP